MEVEKDKDGQKGGSSSPPEQQFDRQRQRFYVELKPGETTIVSWKKLLDDEASHQKHASPPAVVVVSPKDPNENVLEDKSRRKHSGFFVTQEQEKHLKESPVSDFTTPKKRRNDITKAPEKDDDSVEVATKHLKSEGSREKVAAEKELHEDCVDADSSTASSAKSSFNPIGSVAEAIDYYKTAVTTNDSWFEPQSETLTSEADVEKLVKVVKEQERNEELKKCKQKKAAADEMVQEEVSSVIDYHAAASEKQICAADSSSPALGNTVSSYVPAKRSGPPSTASCTAVPKRGKFETAKDHALSQIEKSVKRLQIGGNDAMESSSELEN